jgi:hypothetical protein
MNNEDVPDYGEGLRESLMKGNGEQALAILKDLVKMDVKVSINVKPVEEREEIN